VLDDLYVIQCTLEEIASWLDCPEDTIALRVEEHTGLKFADYYAKKRGKGKVSLRRKQFQTALAGDKTLLIWLGKQYLGQSDKIEIEQETELVTNFEKDQTSSNKE